MAASNQKEIETITLQAHPLADAYSFNKCRECKTMHGWDISFHKMWYPHATDMLAEYPLILSAMSQCIHALK